MMFMQSLNQYIRFRGFVHVFFDKSEAVGIEILCVIADELQIKCLKKQGRAILIHFGDVIQLPADRIGFIPTQNPERIIGLKDFCQAS